MKMYTRTFLMDIWFQNDIAPDIGPLARYRTKYVQIPSDQSFLGISKIYRNFHHIEEISKKSCQE